MQDQTHQLMHAYRMSFEEFAQQASRFREIEDAAKALELKQELDRARANYAAARDALALSLLASRAQVRYAAAAA